MDLENLELTCLGAVLTYYARTIRNRPADMYSGSPLESRSYVQLLTVLETFWKRLTGVLGSHPIGAQTHVCALQDRDHPA